MKNFSSSIQRRKRGTRTEYIARLTYYDKTGKRKGVSKSAVTHWQAKTEPLFIPLSQCRWKRHKVEKHIGRKPRNLLKSRMHNPS
jgi:hypothetical protein